MCASPVPFCLRLIDNLEKFTVAGVPEVRYGGEDLIAAVTQKISADLGLSICVYEAHRMGEGIRRRARKVAFSVVSRAEALALVTKLKTMKNRTDFRAEGSGNNV